MATYHKHREPDAQAQPYSKSFQVAAFRAVPRYFSHVQDGVSDPGEGIDLPDIGEAWSEAVSTCGEMLRDLDGELRPETTWKMQVDDENGEALFTLQFSSKIRSVH